MVDRYFIYNLTSNFIWDLFHLFFYQLSVQYILETQLPFTKMALVNHCSPMKTPFVRRALTSSNSYQPFPSSSPELDHLLLIPVAWIILFKLARKSASQGIPLQTISYPIWLGLYTSKTVRWLGKEHTDLPLVSLYLPILWGTLWQKYISHLIWWPSLIICTVHPDSFSQLWSSSINS